MAPLDSQRDTPGPMTRTVEDAARLLDVLAGRDPLDSRTALGAGHIPPTYTAFLQREGLRAGRIGILRQAFGLADGADDRVTRLFEAAVADLRRAGAEVVDDVRTALARIVEIAAVALAPEDDPETIQGRKDEQRYRDVFGSAMELARLDALALPVWTYPPVLLGDRGQSPTGAMTFIASALQWPVVVVPIGFVGEQLPIGMQLIGKPWSEGQLIQFAYAYEQATHHRRPPPSVLPLARCMRWASTNQWRRRRNAPTSTPAAALARGSTMLRAEDPASSAPPTIGTSVCAALATGPDGGEGTASPAPSASGKLAVCAASWLASITSAGAESNSAGASPAMTRSAPGTTVNRTGVTPMIFDSIDTGIGRAASISRLRTRSRRIPLEPSFGLPIGSGNVARTTSDWDMSAYTFTSSRPSSSSACGARSSPAAARGVFETVTSRLLTSSAPG
jgi:amidase